MPAILSGRRLRQFTVAVFVSPRADDLLGVLLALDINEASAIQQAYEFARDTWGCDLASLHLHYLALEHGTLRLPAGGSGSSLLARARAGATDVSRVPEQQREVADPF